MANVGGTGKKKDGSVEESDMGGEGGRKMQHREARVLEDGAAVYVHAVTHRCAQRCRPANMSRARPFRHARLYRASR